MRPAEPLPRRQGNKKGRRRDLQILYWRKSFSSTGGEAPVMGQFWVTAFTRTFEVPRGQIQRSAPFQSVSRFSDPLAMFALRVPIGQTRQFIVLLHCYKIIDDPPIVL